MRYEFTARVNDLLCHASLGNSLVRGSFLHARLQIAVPHKCDRCIDLKEALVEPLSLCSTLRQDEGGPLPLVGAKNILGQ